MKCETTSSVKECALRARSTHGVQHAIVEVNIVIGVVLGEVQAVYRVALQTCGQNGNSSRAVRGTGVRTSPTLAFMWSTGS